MKFNYKTIIWDFDGVILDSMPIRDKGFETVLKSYPHNEVEELMKYHKQNAGLSRYAKFRYFFKEIRKAEVVEEVVGELASQFKKLMLQFLINKDLLIQDSLQFIKDNYLKYEMHIASGSDQVELRHICEELNLTKYFISINGSPTSKIELVKDILNRCDSKNAVLIGDSINDYDAAVKNAIDFIGYNNENLMHFGCYIESFGNRKYE